MNDLDQLEQKIRAAQERDSPASLKSKDKQSATHKEGMQAGIEFAASIGIAVFIGYHLDSALGTKPLFLILMFFLGTASGFWALYKYSLKGTTKGLYSQLPDEQKAANKTPEN